MKYVLLTLQTQNPSPLEECLFDNELIISVFVSGLKGYEVVSGNILELSFSKWELRINLIDNITEDEISGLCDYLSILAINLDTTVVDVQILEDTTDYLSIVPQRDIIAYKDIVIVNNEEDFDTLENKQSFVLNNDIDKQLSQLQLNDHLIPLLIIQSSAFGTGKHETTKQCMMMLYKLKNLNIDIHTALDLGTGTGVLAIIIAKLWSGSQVDATDIEELSVISANRFTTINEVVNNVNVFLSNGFEKIAKDIKYDVIVSNILLEPLLMMRDDFYSHLNSGGYLVLSGFLSNQQEELITHFTRLSFEVIEIICENNWVCLLLKKI